MTPKLIAAILAAAALPAMAQTAIPRADVGPAAQVQVKEDKARPANSASARDRAKAAKAQQKKNRQLARQKHDSQKKAPAS
ncbi:MAG: hypothetical protein ABIR98_05940 [Usitatibacter sp.]